MRKLRQSLLLLVLLAALPMTAHAQWASKIVEHDWRLKLGENSIGLLQEQIDVGVKYRVTTISLGAYKVTTGLRASYIAALVLVPFGVVGVVALTRPRGR